MTIKELQAIIDQAMMDANQGKISAVSAAIVIIEAQQSIIAQLVKREDKAA